MNILKAKFYDGLTHVFSIKGLVAEHGLETKIYGSVMFGLLEPDAVYGDGEHEWTYGVEPYSKVKNGKTKVYKLFLVSDVIVAIQETDYYVRVKEITNVNE